MALDSRHTFVTIFGARGRETEVIEFVAEDLRLM
jgi:hypothetical protein